VVLIEGRHSLRISIHTERSRSRASIKQRQRSSSREVTRTESSNADGGPWMLGRLQAPGKRRGKGMGDGDGVDAITNAD
jgi:hypothetical protein